MFEQLEFVVRVLISLNVSIAENGEVLCTAHDVNVSRVLETRVRINYRTIYKDILS